MTRDEATEYYAEGGTNDAMDEIREVDEDTREARQDG